MSWYMGPNAVLSIPGQGAVNAELWARFLRGCDDHYRATGKRTQVNSVMRSTQRQAELYAAYLAGHGVLAAKPGTSLHEFGRAIDAQPEGRGADAAWQKHFRAVGLHFPVPREPWHVELAPNRAPLANLPHAGPAPVTPVTPEPPEEDPVPHPFRLADAPSAWYYIDAGRAHRIPSPSVLTALYAVGVIRPHPMAPNEDSGIATIGDAAQIRDMRATYGLA